MSATRRNFLWPLVVLGIGVLLFLAAVEVLPTHSDDLIQRAWPALLILAGLNMLLMERVRFGNWLALLISLAVLGGVIVYAYDYHAERVKTDYSVMLAPEPLMLGENIQGVNISVQTLGANLDFIPAPGRAINATFLGSTESHVNISAQEQENGLLDLVVTEEHVNTLPNIAAMGRGELQVLLPLDMPILNIELTNQNGRITFDFRYIQVPRFNLQNVRGNVDLYLPLAQTAGTSLQIIGDVIVSEGDLTLYIPSSLPIRITGAPNNLDFNRDAYTRDGDIIETRGGLTSFQYAIKVSVPKGTLILKQVEGG